MNPPRSLSVAEQAVVSRLMELGRCADAATIIAALRVVGGCTCGCASIDFSSESGGSAQILGDALGATEDGISVGVILWSVQGKPSSLEIYMPAEDTCKLPDPTSLRPFAVAGI